MSRTLILLLPVLLLFACKKNEPAITVEPPDPIDTVPVPVTHIIELGKSTMYKNGTPWAPPVRALFFNDRYDIFNLRYRVLSANLREENFSLSDIPCKPGKYPMEYDVYWLDGNRRPQPLFLIVQDYDQLIGTYRADTTRTDNFIEILRYDSLTHIVEGRFQTFMGSPQVDHSWGNIPDSVYITDGKFHLQIQKF